MRLLELALLLWIFNRSLVQNGFFVSDIRAPTIASSRLKLSETRAYPRNAGVTIEYQLMLDPGTVYTTVHYHWMGGSGERRVKGFVVGVFLVEVGGRVVCT